MPEPCLRVCALLPTAVFSTSAHVKSEKHHHACLGLVPESVEFEVLPARNVLIALWIFDNIRVDAIHPMGEAHTIPRLQPWIGGNLGYL